MRPPIPTPSEPPEDVRVVPLFFSAALVAAGTFLLIAFQNCSPEGGNNNDNEIRNYYLMEDGYTCHPLSGGEEVSSYRDHIGVTGLQYYFYGDICNYAVTVLSKGEVTVIISDDKSSLNYNDQDYIYFSEPPQSP
jgi:hypothetical protein